MEIADLVSLAFSLAAIIVPQAIRQATPKLNSVILIGGLFAISLLGGYVYKFMTGEDGSPVFSRIFFLAGLSHLLIFAIFQEYYRRLEVRQIQIDHAEKMREKEQ